MTSFPEIYYTDVLLKLLIQPEQFNITPVEYNKIDWQLLLEFARKNIVLVRSYEYWEKEGVTIPLSDYRSTVEGEKNRVCSTLQLINQLTSLCSASGINFVFSKAFQHYPDMGHDVDLLISDTNHVIDDIVMNSLGAVPCRNSILNRVSGKTGYMLKDYSSPLEIHHGHMGLFGEHRKYAEILLSNRTKATIGGVTTFTPSVEDQLIVCALQRVYGHFYVRISDMLHMVSIVQNNSLDWEYIIRQTREMGIFDGLCYIVNVVNRKYKTIFGRDIIDYPQHISVLTEGQAAGFISKKKCFYFPLHDIFQLYIKKLLIDIASQNWASLGKLILIPVLVFNVLLRNLMRKVLIYLNPV